MKRNRMIKQRNILKALFFTLLLSPSMGAIAQTRDFDGVEIKPHKVTDNIYMLEGAGGNIGIFFGPDGQQRNGYEVVGYMKAADFAAHVKLAFDTTATIAPQPEATVLIEKLV